MINIVCKINNDDIYDFKDTYKILYAEKTSQHNKNIHHTFLKTMKDKSLPSFFSYGALDLYYISLFVFSADRLIKRSNFNDSWTRKIKLHIPVIEIDKFKNSKDLMEKMLSFLSGDIWSLEFRKRNLSTYEEKIQKRMEKNHSTRDIDAISMFSGGLDSYIGVIDLLEKEKKLFFVSHYGGGKGVKEYQDILRKTLMKSYPVSEENFFQFHSKTIKGIEDTTRTRSFMFFAHAIALASSFKRVIKLYIPENGLISLNIPIIPSRNGSSSTRTTHPYYMELLQKLLEKLEITVELTNPYQFKTKGEMVKECNNLKLLKESLGNSMSCSHPDNGRYRGETETSHCGTCIPCVIRRASIKASGIKDTSNYYDFNFKIGDEGKKNLKAYKFGLNCFMKNKNNFFKIQASGPIKSNIKEYSSLYERGMKEVLDLIKEFK